MVLAWLHPEQDYLNRQPTDARLPIGQVVGAKIMESRIVVVEDANAHHNGWQITAISMDIAQSDLLRCFCSYGLSLDVCYRVGRGDGAKTPYRHVTCDHQYRKYHSGQSVPIFDALGKQKTGYPENKHHALNCL